MALKGQTGANTRNHMMAMKTWLAVESAANWNADRGNGFRYLGIAESRVQKAKQVKTGDLVFIYIPSPVRAFADIRVVSKDGIGKSEHLMKYDVVCYTGLFTEPLVAVEKAQWLPLAAVRDHLSFGRYPAAGMRVSFREITLSDARVITRSFKRSFPAVQTQQIDERLGLSDSATSRGDLRA